MADKKMDSAKIQRIKNKQAEQLQQFEEWAKVGDWRKIHAAHYDWWMFPVERPSLSYGDLYAVESKEVEALKSDALFLRNYKRGIACVVEAWGWDLEKERPIINPNILKGQQWTGYGVRLGKMSDSLRLFGEVELHGKLKAFFKYCLQQQTTIPISDLPWLTLTLGNNSSDNF